MSHTTATTTSRGMAFVNAFKFGTDLWDPSHRFETSWCLPPYVLCAMRMAFSLYAFFTLFFNLAYQCLHAEAGGCAESAKSFSFFTVLGYWGLAFYLLFAALHTFSYARWNAPLLDHWARPLQALHSLLYTVSVVFPFLTTAVYWGVIYGPQWGRLGGYATPYQLWSNVSQHALNSAFALAEVLLARSEPMPWAHLPFLVLILALYLCLAYLTAATKGFYVYAFLDPAQHSRSVVAAYCVGILAATVVVFLLVRLLVAARLRLTEGALRMPGKFARTSPPPSAWRGSAGSADMHEMNSPVPFASRGAWSAV